MIEGLLAPYEEQLQQAESMPGWGRRSAQDALAETGTDMSRFPTGGAPGLLGRPHPAGPPLRQAHRQGQVQEGQPVPGGLTGETAIAAGKTQTREGARYRRLARRRGKAKAQVAVGNTQLKVYHKLLSSPGMRYQDLGPDYYKRQRGTRRPDRPPRRQARRPRLRSHPRPHPRTRTRRAGQHPGRLTMPPRKTRPARSAKVCCRAPR